VDDDHEVASTIMTCRSVDETRAMISLLGNRHHHHRKHIYRKQKRDIPFSLSLSPVWALDSTGANSQEENAYSGTTSCTHLPQLPYLLIAPGQPIIHTQPRMRRRKPLARLDGSYLAKSRYLSEADEPDRGVCATAEQVRNLDLVTTYTSERRGDLVDSGSNGCVSHVSIVDVGESTSVYISRRYRTLSLENPEPAVSTISIHTTDLTLQPCLPTPTLTPNRPSASTPTTPSTPSPPRQTARSPM
jgi:hypothetical protein